MRACVASAEGRFTMSLPCHLGKVLVPVAQNSMSHAWGLQKEVSAVGPMSKEEKYVCIVSNFVTRGPRVWGGSMEACVWNLRCTCSSLARDWNGLGGRMFVMYRSTNHVFFVRSCLVAWGLTCGELV